MDDSPDQLQQQQERQTIQRAVVAPPRAAESGRRLRFNFRALVPSRKNAKITKRYEFNAREVGEGAFGKVFEAVDKEVGRKVAIKKFEITDREKKSSFDREVVLMKELDHPNICKILETYENERERTVWVVMEYCAGGDVFAQIENGGIEEREAAKIMKQVACALKYSHGRGIAHRDLKPENICFCDADRKNGYIKVIDWGVGFHFNCANMSSAVGSTYYAAPEVLQASARDKYGPACDLWSLGVMTYVMLCGKPPFWGALQEQLRRMNNEKYPMNALQAASREAKDFIRRLLKADPGARMPIDEVLAHPWFSTASINSTTDGVTERTMLDNLRRFSRYSQIDAIAALQVAKQLDFQSIPDIRCVFTDIDKDNDGMLDRHEVMFAFERRYGVGSSEARDVEDVFDLIDADRSGKIDYTEFCAAAYSGDPSDAALRAAFKGFDVNDDNDRITRDEVQRVLREAAPDTWEQLTEEIFTKYDFDQNGYIDFGEFKRWIVDSNRARSAGTPGFGLSDLVHLVEAGNTDAGREYSAPNIARTSQAALRHSHSATASTSTTPKLLHSNSAGPTLLDRSRRMLQEPGRYIGKMYGMRKQRPTTPGSAECSGGAAANGHGLTEEAV